MFHDNPMFVCEGTSSMECVEKLVIVKEIEVIE